MKFEVIHEAVTKAIEDKGQCDMYLDYDGFLRDTERLLQASIYCLDSYNFCPADIKELLEAVEERKGCWVEIIEEGLANAQLPEAYQESVTRMKGAYQMALVWLSYVQRERWESQKD